MASLFIGSLCLQLCDHLPSGITASLDVANDKNFEGLDSDFFTNVISSVQLNADVLPARLLLLDGSSPYSIFHPPKMPTRAGEFNSKPELCGKDAALSASHEASLCLLLRPCVHLNVSAISEPSDADGRGAQLKDFRSLGSLVFLFAASALSDLTHTRKELMYDALGFKPHEVASLAPCLTTRTVVFSRLLSSESDGSLRCSAPRRSPL